MGNLAANNRVEEPEIPDQIHGQSASGNKFALPEQSTFGPSQVQVILQPDGHMIPGSTEMEFKFNFQRGYALTGRHQPASNSSPLNGNADPRLTPEEALGRPSPPDSSSGKGSDPLSIEGQ